MSTVIVKPVWHVDGWAGNTVDDDGTDWFTFQDDGWFSPVDVRNFDQDRPSQGGTYSSPNLDSARVVNLTTSVTALDRFLADKAVNQANALCRGGHLFELLVEEPVYDKVAMVKRASGSSNLTRLTPLKFEFQLILIAPEPRKFSATEYTDSTGVTSDAPGGILWNGPDGTSGLQWNGPAGSTGLEYQSGVGTTGVMVLNNPWSAPTPIRFAITGPITNPSVSDNTSGRTIAYGGDVAAGQTLLIDTGAGSVTLDGANRRPLLTRAEWFGIPKNGSVEVAFRSSAPAPSALATAFWRYASI